MKRAVFKKGEGRRMKDEADRVQGNESKKSFFCLRPSSLVPRPSFPSSVLFSSKGFTLIELMLVVIIIGALTAMVMPRLAGRTEQAKLNAAQADVSANIATALKLYELDNGRFPSSEDGGLGALFTKPSNASNWNGPYLEKKPVDPWGRDYQYKSPGVHRSYDYDLFSLGRDGVESEDDIKNWDN